MTGGKDNSFEALLSDTLRDFVNTEPRTGLEQRILAHVQAGHAPLRYFRWWHMAAALSLIALALVIIFHQKDLSPRNTPIEKTAVAPTSAASLAAQPATEAQHTAARREAVNAESPIQSVFPAPAPPTVEGLRLAKWSQQHPQEATHLLQLQQEGSASEALKIEPIRIAAIEVPLIDTPTLVQGDSQ